MDLDLLSGELTITRKALDAARRLLPSLARVEDHDARVALTSNIRSSLAHCQPLVTLDHNTGDEQALVRLGPSSSAWGSALIKGCTVVTVLDPDGARYIAGRGRARAAAVKPALERIAPLAGEAHRFKVTGWPGVAELAVMADGSGVVGRAAPVASVPPVRATAPSSARPAERIPQVHPSAEPTPAEVPKIDTPPGWLMYEVDDELARQQPRPAWKQRERFGV